MAVEVGDDLLMRQLIDAGLIEQATSATGTTRRQIITRTAGAAAVAGVASILLPKVAAAASGGGPSPVPDPEPPAPVVTARASNMIFSAHTRNQLGSRPYLREFNLQTWSPQKEGFAATIIVGDRGPLAVHPSTTDWSFSSQGGTESNYVAWTQIESDESEGPVIELSLLTNISFAFARAPATKREQSRRSQLIRRGELTPPAGLVVEPGAAKQGSSQVAYTRLRLPPLS